MQTVWNILCNLSKLLNFCKCIWRCPRAPGPRSGVWQNPGAAPQDLGHPCCGAHRTRGIVPLPEILNHLLAASDICFLALTVHFDIICWCFKYSVLYVSCCVKCTCLETWNTGSCFTVLMSCLLGLCQQLSTSGWYVLNSLLLSGRLPFVVTWQ